jgi:hypothetical protein
MNRCGLPSSVRAFAIACAAAFANANVNAYDGAIVNANVIAHLSTSAGGHR